MVDGFAVAWLTITPSVIRHFKSENHGCRFSLYLTVETHGYIGIRPCAVTMQAIIQHVLIVLTNVRGLNCNIDSVHQFLQSSLFTLLSIETQISSSSNTTHISSFPIAPSTLPLFPKQVFYLYHSASVCRLSSLDFPNLDFQLMWLKVRFSSVNFTGNNHPPSSRHFGATIILNSAS